MPVPVTCPPRWRPDRTRRGVVARFSGSCRRRTRSRRRCPSGAVPALVGLVAAPSSRRTSPLSARSRSARRRGRAPAARRHARRPDARGLPGRPSRSPSPCRTPPGGGPVLEPAAPSVPVVAAAADATWTPVRVCPDVHARADGAATDAAPLPTPAPEHAARAAAAPGVRGAARTRPRRRSRAPQGGQRLRACRPERVRSPGTGATCPGLGCSAIRWPQRLVRRREGSGVQIPRSLRPLRAQFPSSGNRPRGLGRGTVSAGFSPLPGSPKQHCGTAPASPVCPRSRGATRRWS